MAKLKLNRGLMLLSLVVGLFFLAATSSADAVIEEKDFFLKPGVEDQQVEVALVRIALYNNGAPCVGNFFFVNHCPQLFV